MPRGPGGPFCPRGPREGGKPALHARFELPEEREEPDDRRLLKLPEVPEELEDEGLLGVIWRIGAGSSCPASAGREML